MQVRVLGRVELLGPGGSAALGGPKERTVLAMLATAPDRSASEEQLVDALWDERPPTTASRTVHSYVSRLRRAAAEVGAPAGWLEGGAGRWRLQPSLVSTDLDEAEQLRLDASTARAADDHDTELDAIEGALACWRGPPLGDLAGDVWAAPVVARLDELRLLLEEERAEAAVAAGRSDRLIPDLQRLCTEHPLRERLWAARMRALYRAGRQAEALRCFAELRTLLVEELGLAPSPALVALEHQILDHDPALLTVETATVAAGPPTEAPVTPAAEPGARFVGRGEERAALLASWERASRGLEVLLLAGEPGIGKSALVAEHARAVAGTSTSLFGHSDEEPLIPFQPFVEAILNRIDDMEPDELRTMLGPKVADLALLVPTLADRLPEVTGIEATGAEVERYRLFEVVPHLLQQLARRLPVLLALDDLHWADRPTLELLQHVVRRCRSTPMQVVLSYRDTDLDRSHQMAAALGELRRSEVATRISLRGLQADDVAALLEGETGADGDVRLAKVLHEQTDGHPFFLREMLRHLLETGEIERGDDGTLQASGDLDRLRIPEGIAEVIGRRLSRLDEATNDTLRAAAVMGAESRLPVLAAVLDRDADEVLDHLEAAIAAGVLREVPSAVGQFAFTHALVRHSLYGELSTTRRVRLHQRVADAIERAAPAGDPATYAELAHHFGESAVAGTAPQAIDYARRAGDHARSLLAYEDATRQYAAALEIATDHDSAVADRADLLLAMGHCQWMASDVPGAHRSYERVVELLGSTDPRRLAQAALGYAGIEMHPYWVTVGKSDPRSIELLEVALDALPLDERALRARVLSGLAQHLYFRPGTRPRRRQLVDEALAIVDALDEPRTELAVVNAAALALIGPDDTEEQLDLTSRGIELARALGERRLEAHAALRRIFVATQLGLVDETEELLAFVQQLEKECDPASRVYGPMFAAGPRLVAGDLDEANDLLNTAFARAQEHKDANAFSVFLGGAVALAMLRDRADELLGALATFDAGFDDSSLKPDFVIAAVLADLGHPAEAKARIPVDVADELSFPRDAFWMWLCFILARVHARTGDREAGAQLRSLLAPYAGHVAAVASYGGGPVDTALGWCAFAAGDLDGADAHLLAGIDFADRHGWRAPALEAQLWLGRTWLRRDAAGDIDAARSLLGAVLEEATSLGLAAVAREAAELLGEANPFARAERQPTRRDRARAFLADRGIGIVGRWTAGAGDDELWRRFGPRRSQKLLFAALAGSFRPAMAKGFEGDLVFVLESPRTMAGEPRSDSWTIRIEDGRASVEEGRSPDPAVLLRAELPTFVRMAAGEQLPGTAIADGKIHIEGDVLLAVRIPDLFGFVPPIEVS